MQKLTEQEKRELELYRLSDNLIDNFVNFTKTVKKSRLDTKKKTLLLKNVKEKIKKAV